MIKHACERGTYIIANQILKRKVVIKYDYSNPFHFLMYPPPKISKIKYNVKLSSRQDNKPKNP